MTIGNGIGGSSKTIEFVLLKLNIPLRSGLEMQRLVDTVCDITGKPSPVAVALPR